MDSTTMALLYLELLKRKIFAYDFCQRMKKSAKDFTRIRKNGLPFKELFEDGVPIALNAKDAVLFHGYRILAIDGTLAILPNSAELVAEFGKTTSCAGKIYARISLVVDVLNEFIVDGEIFGHDVGERILAQKHIDKDLCENALYLFDRGYWNQELVSTMINNERKFLMRVQSNHFPEAVKNFEKSDYIDFFHKESGARAKLRYYKFILNSGETEYLVTNLDEETVPDSFYGDCRQY